MRIKWARKKAYLVNWKTPISYSCDMLGAINLSHLLDFCFRFCLLKVLMYLSISYDISFTCSPKMLCSFNLFCNNE